MNSFWCMGTINGQLQSQCVNGAPPPNYILVDPQIGYDASLGRWIATTLDAYVPPLGTVRTSATPDYLYIAVSNTGTATGTPSNWTKWSIPVCTDNSNFPNSDQPLLGWSAGVVGVDVVCSDNSDVHRGEDNLVVINNSTLTSGATSLPNPIVPPCIGMTPARDEDVSSFSSLYLVASIVPNGSTTFSQPPGCGTNSNNTSPYVVEYTATTAGVFGQNTSTACSSGTPCAPYSQTSGLSNPGVYARVAADQAGCNGQPTCEIDVGNARIKAAQIRQDTSFGGSPFLTLGFSTGFQASVNLTGSQALWALQNLSANAWTTLALLAGGNWYSYANAVMDSDGDLYLGSTLFQSASHPSTLWDLFTATNGTNLTFQGQNITESSTQEYTGDGVSSPQRWGDYNSLIYDPNAIGPGGEGGFWAVEEISCSSLSTALCLNPPGTDEATSWVALQDPAPFFVGTSENETEARTSCSPATIQTSVSPPPGVQNGDVIIAILEAGVSGGTPGLPPGWRLLNMVQGTTSLNSMDTLGACGAYEISWIAVHVYSTSDQVPYNFSFQTTPVTDSCNTNLCFTGESITYLNAYRFAGTDFTKYGAYGYANHYPSTTSSTGPITVLEDRKVLTVFSGTGDSDETGECERFSTPTGSPTLTVETTFTPNCTLPSFLSADVWNKVHEALIGGYSEAPGSIQILGSAPLPAWQVVIPEPNS